MQQDSERWARIAAWFDELVDLPHAQRAARLAAIATEDPAAAAEVKALLHADSHADGVLDANLSTLVPSLMAGADSAAPEDGRAGPYRLLHVIGEGGMGAVFLAERSDGSYEQQVAVKLIKRGMDSVAILRRFLSERRILARLAHPNIVRLLDGGMSADGRPYYVMEYVDGSTITEHAAAKHLSIRARVALVAQVAETAAYAHAQLVVHRDLKPSNILVDRQGEPRVLDFGIAKLIEDGGEQTRTATGMRVLSPAYAAPEQILGEAIGTATDVYALGLILCELLAGQLPQPQNGATRAQWTPGTVGEDVERASTLARKLTPERIAELHGPGLSPAQLERKIRGDIDVIIATALQREPSRRYPTAAAFADDLRRWLDGRPITARADSGAYRLAKFVRRHRIGVAATVLIALSLLGGLGVALWQARIATAEAARADTERAHAERQLARTERVKEFMLTLFREQDPVSRAKAQARSAPELIRDGIAQIDAAFAKEPELQAELLRDLGEIQVSLDDRKNGQATLQRAWELQSKLSGADSADTAEALAAYGAAVYTAGDVVKASTMLREAVTRLRAAGRADRVNTAQAESTLATLLLIQGDYEESERLAKHAVEVYRAVHGAEDPEVAPRLAVLAKIQQEQTKYTDALANYNEALRIVVHSQGDDHVRTVSMRTQIGDVLRNLRKYDEALAYYEAALRIERAQLPAGHIIIAGTLIRYADVQRRTGKLDAADKTFTEAIAIYGQNPSGQYAQALQLHGNLARAQGRVDVAVQRYRDSLAAFRTTTGDSIYTWLTQLKLVEMLTEADRLDEADRLGTEAAAAISRLSKDDSYDSAYSANVMGLLRRAQGRPADAVPLLRHTLTIMQTIYNAEHAEVAQAQVFLAASLIATRDSDARSEAANLIETAKAAYDRGGDPDAQAQLGALYLERSRLRLDSGDVAGARSDIEQALPRLQAPEQASLLREARAHAGRIGVRT
jgi:serine/threonine-protein kinase